MSGMSQTGSMRTVGRVVGTVYYGYLTVLLLAGTGLIGLGLSIDLLSMSKMDTLLQPLAKRVNTVLYGGCALIMIVAYGFTGYRHDEISMERFFYWKRATKGMFIASFGAILLSTASPTFSSLALNCGLGSIVGVVVGVAEAKHKITKRPR